MTQGGGVAAPVGGQVFSEILPYLEVSQGNQDEVEVIEQIQMPDVIGKSIQEAEKILKENGIESAIQNNNEELDKENTYVQQQVPTSGIRVNKGSKCFLY